MASRESRDADARSRGFGRAGVVLVILDRRESLDIEARSLVVRVSPSWGRISLAALRLARVDFGGCKPDRRDDGRGNADGFGIPD